MFVPDSTALAIADVIRQVVNDHLPLSFRDRTLPDTMPLDADGAGLDSVNLVELLLACETATGVVFPADLLATGPVTVARLIEHATQPSAHRAHN